MSRTSGFTLIEILIAVTLSAGIFLALLGFLGSGLSSVFQGKKLLSETLQSRNIDTSLATLSKDVSLKNISISSTPSLIETGVLLHSDFYSSPYVFIGSETGYTYCSGSSPLSRLILAEGYSFSWETRNAWAYTIIWNTILSGASDKIIGTGFNGDHFDGEHPLNTELSNPSSLALLWNILFIADTGNNRVLAYDPTTTQLIKVIQESDGIIHPMSIAIEWLSLLIGAENGLYRLWNGNGNGNTLSLNITPSSDFDSIKFTFNEDSVSTGTFTAWFIWGTGSSMNPWVLEYDFPSSQTSISWTIENISLAPVNPWAYVVRVSASNAWTEAFSGVFPWFVKSNSILSGSGRILEKLWAGRTWNVHSSTDYTTSPSSVAADKFLSGSGASFVRSIYPIENLQITKSGSLITLHYFEYAPYTCQEESWLKIERVRTFVVQ